MEKETNRAYNIIFGVAKFDMITVVGVIMVMLSVCLLANQRYAGSVFS